MKLTVEQYDAIEKCVNKILENRKLVDAPKEDPEAWREEYRKKQAAGVKFEFDYGSNAWEPKFCPFTGRKEWYREVPQEVQKEGDMRIPEASEIRKWADRYYSLWCFVENSLPRDASSDTFDIFRGYARQVNDEIYGVTDKAKEPHEVWKWENMKGNWLDLLPNEEPQWMPGHKYRAECEKYGYAVVSEINEVVEKPKTVKYTFALVKVGDAVSVRFGSDKENLIEFAKNSGYTIIGDIEEREIEA